MEKKAPNVVKDFLLSRAAACVHKPDGILRYRFATPSYGVSAGADDNSDIPERSRTGRYLQMYDWDACFFSQAAHAAGIEDLQVDVVRNFLSLKEADGHVPRTVSSKRIWDTGDYCKPFLCQTLLSQIRAEKARGKETNHSSLIDDLDCYLQSYERERKAEQGLYRWRNVLESGVDNNLSLLSPREAAKDEDDSISNFPDGRLLAVDLSSYLCAEFRAFAAICTAYGRSALAAKYEKSAALTAKAIDDHLWNEELSLYCNLSPAGRTHVTVRAWTGLTPVLFGVTVGKKVKQVIENNIINQAHFFRPAGLSSLAASELLYNNAARGLYGRAIVSNWQGPVWVLPSVLAVRCLVKEGYNKQAEELAARVIQTLYADIQDNGTLHENYHAETGKALWAPQFMSWNILALDLVDVLA
jgi:neutral trehalase